MCNGANMCATCATGYVVQLDGTCAFNCTTPTNCFSCSAPNVCGTCNNNTDVNTYTLNLGSCFVCNLENCLTCNEDNKCLTCTSTQLILSDTFTCVSCPL